MRTAGEISSEQLKTIKKLEELEMAAKISTVFRDIRNMGISISFVPSNFKLKLLLVF